MNSNRVESIQLTLKTEISLVRLIENAKKKHRKLPLINSIEKERKVRRN